MSLVTKKTGLLIGVIAMCSVTWFLLQANSASTTAPTSNPVVAVSADGYTKPSDEEIRNKLTPIQYRVTQHEGTEPPFSNAFWDNKEEGIYVDVVSGEPLFSSKEKFKSGTGWPSFYSPLIDENIIEKSDFSLLGTRTEVRSRFGDSHLGHVFNDGPEPTGLRYCINSAALRFVPAAELAASGYEKFEQLFNSSK
jgi:peptide methionine sulfoxide reductase msrA/msrB